MQVANWYCQLDSLGGKQIESHVQNNTGSHCQLWVWNLRAQCLNSHCKDWQSMLIGQWDCWRNDQKAWKIMQPRITSSGYMVPPRYENMKEIEMYHQHCDLTTPLKKKIAWAVLFIKKVTILMLLWNKKMLIFW